MEEAITICSKHFNIKLDKVRFSILSFSDINKNQFLGLVKTATISSSYEELRVFLANYDILPKSDIEIWKKICKSIITLSQEVYKEMGYDKINGSSKTYVNTFLHMLDENKNKLYKDKTLIFEFMNIYNSSLLENEKIQHYFRTLKNRSLIDQSICLNIMARLQS